MYQWTDVYTDDYLKERIEEVRRAQKKLAEKGQVLCSEYEQLWLVVAGRMPEVEYVGGYYRAPYGEFRAFPSRPFHGALVFTPAPGASAADLPPELLAQIEWQPATATLDLDERTVKIRVEDAEITFSGVNVHISPRELLRDINRELVRSGAGAYVWQIAPLLDAPSPVKHLYPDGNVPSMSNVHVRADVTGYALRADRPYQRTLVYAGLAAHKTSVESLWASLIRGKAGASMRGLSLVADGDVKLLATALPDFGVVHAGILVRKALPGKWEPADDCAYALVFDAGVNVEAELQTLTVKRLQETLSFPVPDEWTKTIWEYALDAGYIERLETGGDCRGGVCLDLTKDWQALVQGLLEQELVTI